MLDTCSVFVGTFGSGLLDFVKSLSPLSRAEFLRAEVEPGSHAPALFGSAGSGAVGEGECARLGKLGTEGSGTVGGAVIGTARVRRFGEV